MVKDRGRDQREETLSRESESPAHKQRRQVRRQLDAIELDDLDELGVLDDFDLDAFEPIKKGAGRR